MRRTALVTAASCVLTLTCLPAAAQPSPARGSSPGRAPALALTTTETGCTEIAYWRGGLASTVRPLVPDRYELAPFPAPEGFPARVALLVNELTCRVAVNTGPDRHDRQRGVTTVLVSVSTTSVDGQPSDGFYNLRYATENRTQQRALARAGWSADLLRRRSGVDVSTSPGGLTEAAFAVTGAGWDHEVSGATIFPLDQPTSSQIAFRRDTSAAQLQLCFDGSFASAPGAVTGDLTTTPLSTVTAAPPVYAGFSGTAPFGTVLGKGEQRATLTDQACPVVATQ